MLKQILYILSIICALFVNTNLAPFLGIDNIITTAFSPILLFIGIQLVTGKINSNSLGKNPMPLIIIILAIWVIIIKSGLGQDYFKAVFYFLMIPMLLSISFEVLTRKEIVKLKGVFLFFYIVECTLAIIERITHVIFFYIENQTYEEIIYATQEAWEFRSYALFPHPLANAMVVVIIMTFIVCGNLSLKQKMSYFLLGYVSLFCFNARGAILLGTFCILPYFIWKINKIAKKKVIINIGLLSTILLMIYLVTNTSLGGRLLYSEQLMDGSAQTRLEVFSFYNFLSSQDLWWGGNEDIYHYVMIKLGAGGVENGFIVLLLQYGIILGPIILFLLFAYQIKLLTPYYSKVDKYFILFVFYIMGFMNPALASSTPWIIFLFSYYSLKSSYEKNIMASHHSIYTV